MRGTARFSHRDPDTESQPDAASSVEVTHAVAVALHFFDLGVADRPGDRLHPQPDPDIAFASVPPDVLSRGHGLRLTVRPEPAVRHRLTGGHQLTVRHEFTVGH